MKALGRTQLAVQSAVDGVQVDLLLASADLHLDSGVWQQSHAEWDRLRVASLRELPVVLEQNMSQRNLDLVGSEEATGASMLSMTEAGVL